MGQLVPLYASVGIIGLRERGTAFPFNAGLTWFRADRAAVTRVVRDVNERIDFFSGVKDEPFRLEEIGIGEKCLTDQNLPKLYFDQSVYNDALESSALNDDVYTRSRMPCDADNRDTKFNCIKNFPETGCLMLEPEFGSGDGFANFKSRNGKIIKCSTDPDADVNDAPAAAAAVEGAAAGEETKKPEEKEEAAPAADVDAESADATPAAAKPAAEESTSSDADAAPAAEDAAPAAEAKAAPATATEEEKETVLSTPAAAASTTEEETAEPQGDSAATPAGDSEESSTPESAERRKSHRRRLLANPIKIREFQLHRRAVLQDEAEAKAEAKPDDAAEAKPDDAAAAAEAAPSADQDLDFTEKPAKACVAADDVLASWLWSEDQSGKEGKWSMKNPVALGYHFVASKDSAAEKVKLMKEVLEK
jgi:hypothetical protein